MQQGDYGGDKLDEVLLRFLVHVEVLSFFKLFL